MYNQNNQKSANTKIQTLYAPGFSYLAMSLYMTKFVFNFVPWLSQDNTGRSQYSKDIHLSTTITPEVVAYFYTQATSILDGTAEKEIEAVLPCKNDATLFFQYKPDENNQMSAYLTINKDNKTISFRFPTIEYEEMSTKAVR